MQAKRHDESSNQGGIEQRQYICGRPYPMPPPTPHLIPRYTLSQTLSNKGADMSEIRSKPSTTQYRKNWDKIFNKPVKIVDRTELEKPCNGENYVVKSK